jgi:RimJ/RimL family protein N-acetyltransferase
MFAPKPIRTERLLLRAYKKTDARAMFEAIDESRAHLSQWLEWPPEIKRVADLEYSCETAAADWSYGRDFRVGIFSSDGKRYFGHCGLHYPDWDVRSLEIGYWLRVSATGHGYMREAVGGLTRFAFDDLKARRVEIRCDPRNIRSSKIAEANGFLLEGRLRNARLTPARELRDTLVYGMTDEDFRSKILKMGSVY